MAIQSKTASTGRSPAPVRPRRHGRSIAVRRPLPGSVVVETFPYDDDRKVTVYVPGAPPDAVIYAADGQGTASWGATVDRADLASTLIVGVHAAPDETERLHEYSLGLAPAQFESHETFFVEDVRRWVRGRWGTSLPRERTAVFGASAGGELALALGVRHPEVYGVVLCASPGAGYHPPHAMPPALPRAYLVAGTREPFFLEQAERWAQALQTAGAEVRMVRRAGSHGGAFWRNEFPHMVRWAFGSPVGSRGGELYRSRKRVRGPPREDAKFPG